MIFFNYPERLFFLFLLIPLVSLFVFDHFNRNKVIKWYPVSKNSFFQHTIWRFIAYTAMLLSFSLIVFAFAGPYTDKHDIKKQKSSGEETLFLVDVSKSMLAEDVLPSRLGRVKLDILDFASRHPNSRFGLIAYAGSAVIKSPLTSDSYFFSSAVMELNPTSVSLGSTSLASALNTTLKMFPNTETPVKRNLIIFTDGEDHEDDPIPFAKKLEAQGARMLFIVLGNNETGARIPITDNEGNKRFLVDNNQEIWSKPNISTIEEITKQSQNAMLVPAYDRNYHLYSIYEQFIDTVGEAKVSSASEGDTDVRVDYKITSFAVFALLFALLSIFLFQISKWRLKFDE